MRESLAVEDGVFGFWAIAFALRPIPTQTLPLKGRASTLLPLQGEGRDGDGVLWRSFTLTWAVLRRQTFDVGVRCAHPNLFPVLRALGKCDCLGGNSHPAFPQTEVR